MTIEQKYEELRKRAVAMRMAYDMIGNEHAAAPNSVCPQGAGFMVGHAHDDGCTLRERIVDRIANLLHLAHACGVEVDDLCATARMHFDAEAPDTYVYREE